MFVALCRPIDCVHMHAPFMGKRTLSHEGLMCAQLHIGSFIDEARQFRQPLQAIFCEYAIALLLDAQIGDHGNQVCISTAFAKAVNGALHLQRACVDPGQRVGNGQVAIIVAMDADGDLLWRQDFSRQAGDVSAFIWQGSSVGVSQYDQLGPCLCGDAQRLGGVIWILLPAIKAMFRIVNDLTSTLCQETNAVGNHCQVFFE